MGQYYTPVVINSNGRMKFDSWDYGSGLKLMEHSWIGNEFVNAVYTVISEEPALVGWIGDYSSDVGCGEMLYKYAWGGEEHKTAYTKIKPEKYFYKEGDSAVYGEGYLVNHSLFKYIDMKQYVEQAKDTEWVINPLPLLTAIGNGLGGGDYRGINEKLVGSWFMDLIEFTKDKPSDYEDITDKVVFAEDR